MGITILPETTKFPISLIGERAGVCWGGDITDPDKNYRRGMDCILSGHGRTLEYVNIETIIDGYSARVIREWYTHIGGAPTRLQESTRYIDYGNKFGFVIPPSIAGDVDAMFVYLKAMDDIAFAVKTIEGIGIPREDAAMLLPLGMKTRVVDKRNLRNLVDMAHQRMCTRAYWEYRDLFADIRGALMGYSDEWQKVVNMLLVSKCDYLRYCPEKHSCGRHEKA